MPVFDTPEPITADIDIVGRVQVTASDRADTAVEVLPADPADEASVQAAEQTTVEFSGGRLLVKRPRLGPLASLIGPRGSVKVTVGLPAGSHVKASSLAGITITGPLGEAILHSSIGDLQVEEASRLEANAAIGSITVDRVAGPAEVTTSNGTIRIGTLEGAATLESANGSITVDRTAGALQVKSANSDITLRETAGVVQVKSANSSITIGRSLAGITARTAWGRIRIDEVVSGTVHLETGRGDVSIGIAEGTAAWLDLHSKSGVVRSDLDAADGPETSDTVAEIRVHTDRGDIDIHRS
jgi:Putative adhesin